MTYPIVRTSKAKAWVAAFGTLVTVAAAVFADDLLDVSEVVSVVVALVTAAATVAAVYQVPNKSAR